MSFVSSKTVSIINESKGGDFEWSESCISRHTVNMVMLFNKTVSSLAKKDMLVLFPAVKAYIEQYSIKENDVTRTIESINNSVFSC